MVDRNLQILEKRYTSGAIALCASLTNCSEATITLTVAAPENVSASRGFPLTIDSKGRTSFELVTIRPTDSSKPWRYHYDYRWQVGRRGKVASSPFVYVLPYTNETHFVTQADLGSFSHQLGSGNEHAIDWAMPVGTIVGAARDGTVVALRQDSDVGGADPKYKSSCNYVVIAHDDGTFSEYCHLRMDGVVVRLGQKVKAREQLGFSGDTGFRSSAHLHFSVFQTIDGGTRNSISVQFETRPGEMESLKQGKRY
jgi:murein DD-endopeptidase MepM/ murein hydrolase activator NlpD